MARRIGQEFNDRQEARLLEAVALYNAVSGEAPIGLKEFLWLGIKAQIHGTIISSKNLAEQAEIDLLAAQKAARDVIDADLD